MLAWISLNIEPKSAHSRQLVNQHLKQLLREIRETNALMSP